MGGIILRYQKELSTSLVLVGGSLGLVFSLVSLILVALIFGISRYGYQMLWQYSDMMARYGMFGYPESSITPYVMLVWSLLGLFGSTLSIYCGLTYWRNVSNDIFFKGLVGGFLLLLTFSWVSSLMVLVGSILGYFKQIES